MSESAPKVRVFRLSPLAYAVVLFLFIGALPLAFAADGTEEAPSRIGLQSLILIVPIITVIYVARTATAVGTAGILVRAPFGKRVMPWSEVRGLSVTGSSVYAVLRDGSVRLPCVRVSNLADVARASGGRLPEIADPTPKFPPSRRRR